jgi:DNA-binding NtrC family response regulator
LIAEDDDALRPLLVQALVRAGYEVCAVKDGVELLLELARDGKFRHDSVDVVLADVRMPVCSGLDVLETIHTVCPSVPVVLLTGFASTEMRARVQQLGAALLEKPVKTETLRRVIAEHVATRRRQTKR